MLVELELALPVVHPQFERHDAGQQLTGQAWRHGLPLGRVARLVVGNQLLEQRVLGGGIVVADQTRRHGAVHGDVVPGWHARQVGIDARRHVGVRPQEAHHRPRPLLQVPPLGVGPRHMPQQRKMPALLPQMQRQMGHKRQALVIQGDQAGKRVFAHQLGGQARVLAGELRWQVHGGRFRAGGLLSRHPNASTITL